MFSTVGLNETTGSTNWSTGEQAMDDFGYYFQTVFCSFIVLPTVVLNTLTIAFLLKDRKSSATSGFKTFAIALALTDLLVGAVNMPLHAYQGFLQRSPFGPVGCAVWTIVDYGLTSVSIFLMVAMGADRSKCVTSPLVYRLNFNRLRAVVISVSLWILGFTVWLPIILVTLIKYGYVGQTSRCNLSNVGEWILLQISVAYIIPILVMVVVNFRLVLSIKKRSNISEVYSLSSQASGKGNRMIQNNNDRNGNKLIVKSGSHTGQEKGRSVTMSYRNRQCIKISLLIVLSFLVCWTPFCILKPVNVLHRNLIPAPVYFVLSFLPFLNSAITPLIYVVTSGKVRNGIKDLLCRRKRSRHIQVYSIEETGLDDVSENLTNVQIGSDITR